MYGSLSHRAGGAPPLEAEEADDAHAVCVSRVEDERLLTFAHPMEKQHIFPLLPLSRRTAARLSSSIPRARRSFVFRAAAARFTGTVIDTVCILKSCKVKILSGRISHFFGVPTAFNRFCMPDRLYSPCTNRAG